MVYFTPVMLNFKLTSFSSRYIPLDLRSISVTYTHFYTLLKVYS